MLEWIILSILILISIISIILFPKAKVFIILNVFNIIRKNEYKIVQATYNNLPRFIKDNIDSKTLADIISGVLLFGIGTIENELKKKK